MNFCTNKLNMNNKREYTWYCMEFKKDFVDFLGKYGRLPIANIKESMDKIIQAHQEVKEAKENEAQFKQEVKEAKEEVKRANEKMDVLEKEVKQKIEQTQDAEKKI